MSPTPFLAAVLLMSCTTSIETFPQRNRCVFDSQRRLIGVGSVIAKRDDGAYLFQFNDSTQGDHGYLWVEEGGTRRLGPCKSVSTFDANQPGTPPTDPFKREP